MTCSPNVFYNDLDFLFCRYLFHVVIVLAIMFSHIYCFTINMFL